MSWVPGSNKPGLAQQAAAFFWWQVESEAYWLLSESGERGDCFFEGWDL